MRFDQKRPTKALITGASGFIGRRLCEHFSQHGVQCYVPLVRSTAATGLLPRNGHVAVGDLLNTAQIRLALEGCDAVVHLAHSGQGPLTTRRLVDSAIAGGVRRFVHLSSMAVHGPVPGPEAAREETARLGRYNHDYSDSKAEQEEIVQAAHDRGDLEVVILRPTIVYGPRSHFVSQVLEEARDGQVKMFDHGAGICNAVYVDDVCRAIDAALLTKEAVGHAMFINGNESISWLEFSKAFASMITPIPDFVNLSSVEAMKYWAANPPVQVNGLVDRVILKLKKIVMDTPASPLYPPLGRVQRETFPIFFINDKAKELLDWAPEISFQEGVAMTRKWLESGEI